jgi:hypothetical protein
MGEMETRSLKGVAQSQAIFYRSRLVVPQQARFICAENAKTGPAGFDRQRSDLIMNDHACRSRVAGDNYKPVTRLHPSDQKLLRIVMRLLRLIR